MAYPRAFISFDYDHNLTEKILFVGQAKNSKTPFNIEDWSSKDELPQSRWEQLIKDKINRCNLMVVLVGRSMVSATGVDKEIAFARENNIPYFGVYVNGAGVFSNLPNGLARNRVISWDWDLIASAITQMMTEGKNRL